ncbi:YacA [Escherichia coli]|nr:YacA [Escherichia coli]
MAQVNMSLRIDAELKDAFMAAAKSMDRNGSQLIRDFMRTPRLRVNPRRDHSDRAQKLYHG